jgi:cytochrome c5
MALVTLAVAIAARSSDGPRRRSVYPDALPASPGRTIAEQRCLMCHSATLMTQQRKDSTGWEKTVKQMETWGAPVAPAEHDSLIRYLRKHFGAGG